MLELSVAELTELVASPFADETIAEDDTVNLVVVDHRESAVPDPGSLPVVVCAIGDPGDGDRTALSGADAVVRDDDVAALTATTTAAPIVATSLAVLLRAGGMLDVEAGLAAESAV